MKLLHLLVVLAAIAAGLALPATADDDLAALVRRHVDGSDEARLKVIDAGLAAIPPLVEVMKTEEGRPADRAERAIGWIIDNAASNDRECPKATWTLVNLLVDRERPLRVRQMAAKLMGSVGGEGAVRTLAPLLSEKELRDAALWSLQRIEGRTARQALVTAAEAGDPSFRAAAIGALAARRDRPVDLFTKLARDPSAVVRTAALDALEEVADPATAPFLAERVKQTSGEERSAALLAYIAATQASTKPWQSEATRALQEALEWSRGDSTATVAALEALSRTRFAEARADVVGSFLKSPDPAVQVAAASALAGMSGFGEEPMMVLAAALRGATVPQAVAILSAMADRCAQDRQRLAYVALQGARLSFVPYWKEQPSSLVAAIAPAANASQPRVRAAALKALGAIGHTDGAPAVVAAMTDTDAPAEVTRAAFDAYLDIAAWQLHENRPEEARQIYEGALQAAEDDADKVAALRGLERVGSPQSLPIVEAHLDAEGAVGEAALDAFTACAEGTGIDLASRDGYVTHWWVIGPFPSDEQFSGYGRAFFPEEKVQLAGEQEFEGEKMTWRHHHTSDRQGIVDYVPLFDPHENAVCYAYAEVKVAQEADARLHVGSDDGIVVWLNGERVHGINVPRGLKVGEDKVDVHVRNGTNTILIKVIQGPGDWSSSVRLTDRDDEPLPFQQKTQ
jgi:HEAT repeat protein